MRIERDKKSITKFPSHNIKYQENLNKKKQENLYDLWFKAQFFIFLMVSYLRFVYKLLDNIKDFL